MIPKPEIIAMTGDNKQKQVLLRFSDGAYRLFRGAVRGGSLAWGLMAIDRESALSFFESSERKFVQSFQ